MLLGECFISVSLESSNVFIWVIRETLFLVFYINSKISSTIKEVFVPIGEDMTDRHNLLAHFFLSTLSCDEPHKIYN